MGDHRSVPPHQDDTSGSPPRAEASNQNAASSAGSRSPRTDRGMSGCLSRRDPRQKLLYKLRHVVLAQSVTHRTVAKQNSRN